MSIVAVGEMTREQFTERWFGKHVLENCKRDLDALLAEERRKALEEAAYIAKRIGIEEQNMFENTAGEHGDVRLSRGAFITESKIRSLIRGEKL